MVRILGEPLDNFSYIFRLNEEEFIKYEKDREVSLSLSFKELVGLTGKVKPIELSILADERGLWLPISNDGTSEKPLEFLPLVVTKIKPENMIIIDMNTEGLFKYKLDDEETLAYYEHIINELDKTEINFCAKKWCNYLEYKNKVKNISDKKPKIETSHLRKLIQFAETWLTTNICTESSIQKYTQNEDSKTELLISEKTYNNIKEIIEEVITLKEKKIPKSIIDTQQLTETLKKLNTRYEFIIRIMDLVRSLYDEGEILYGDLAKKVKEGQYKDINHLSKTFFVWSCYCAAQGLDLLIHGYTRIGLGKYAEGIQLISNGVDHLMYGLFFSMVCCSENLEEAFNKKVKAYPEHISFKELDSNRFSIFSNSSQNDAFREKHIELLEILRDIEQENNLKSLRNKSPYSHGLAPVILTTREIKDIGDAIKSLLSNYDFFSQHSFQIIKANLEFSLQNCTDEEKEELLKADYETLQNFYYTLKELRLTEVELDLNEEINFAELLKRFLCYSCIEKAYSQLNQGTELLPNGKNRRSQEDTALIPQPL